MPNPFDQLPPEIIIEGTAPNERLELQMRELALLNTPRPEDSGTLAINYVMPDGLDADGNIRPAEIG